MRRSLAAAVIVFVCVTPAIASTSPIAPSIAPAFPEDLGAAKSVDRIAWLAYDHGQRNAHTAAAPDFKPVRITSFLDDDGIVLSNLDISDEGSTVTFLARRSSQHARMVRRAHEQSERRRGGLDERARRRVVL